MTTYTAYFRTDAEFATREIKAATPEQALKKARRFYDNDPLDLMFESYGGMSVNEIAINDANDHELAVWLDEDLGSKLERRFTEWRAPALKPSATDSVGVWIVVMHH